MNGLLSLLVLLQLALLVLASPLGEKDAVAPPSTGRPTYRQATRKSILDSIARRQRKKEHKPRQAAQPSQTVYPACSGAAVDVVPQSGFSQFPGYYIPRVSPQDVPGSWRTVSSQISCVMLCQERDACTGTYWSKTARTCSQRQGRLTGAAFIANTNGDGGIPTVEGDCATLAPQINNATIMRACCNNNPPSARTVCTTTAYRGFSEWSLAGQVQLGTANQLTNAQGGFVTVATTGAGGIANCITACNTFTTNGYNNQTLGCTAAYYDANRRTNGANNCFLYAGSPTTMTYTTNTNMVTIVKGTCAQRNANGIIVNAPCCDST